MKTKWKEFKEKEIVGIIYIIVALYVGVYYTTKWIIHGTLLLTNWVIDKCRSCKRNKDLNKSKETEKIFKCDDNCDANMGGRCMWKIDKELSNLARDENYKMCEKLRNAILKKKERENN